MSAARFQRPTDPVPFTPNCPGPPPRGAVLAMRPDAANAKPPMWPVLAIAFGLLALTLACVAAM